jgi:hypothetical protein
MTKEAMEEDSEIAMGIKLNHGDMKEMNELHRAESFLRS